MISVSPPGRLVPSDGCLWAIPDSVPRELRGLGSNQRQRVQSPPSCP